MNRSYLIFFLLINTSLGFAQINAAINGSFELASRCPNEMGAIKYATGYYNLGSRTTDLFSTCANQTFGVPRNGPGYQWAYDGYSYAGIIATTENRQWYDYVIGTLDTSNMIDGALYCISVVVSLAENSPYAINQLGAFFSPYNDYIRIPGPFGRTNLFLPSHHSIDSIHYKTPISEFQKPTEFLVDTENWVRIHTFLTYTKGVDNYFWIGVLPGNGFKRKLVNDDQRIFNPDNTAYYFLDDVRIFEVRTDTQDLIPELVHNCERPFYVINNELEEYTLKVYKNDTLIKESTNRLEFDLNVDFQKLTIVAENIKNCHTIVYKINENLSNINSRRLNIIYPNPNDQNFAFVDIMNTKTNHYVLCNIYNADGKLLSENKYPLDIGLNKVAIDISHLSTSLYFVEILNNTCHQMHKLVVQRR